MTTVIKLADGARGNHFSSPHHPSTCMSWERIDPTQDFPGELVVYTNYFLQEAVRREVGKRVAWLSESRGVAWWTYDFLEDHLNDFDHVLSHDRSVVERDPQRCTFVPRGECWLDSSQIGLHAKSKLVSFISSDKKFDTWGAPGHGLRQDLYRVLSQDLGSLANRIKRCKVRDEIDVYGSITGHNMPSKAPSLVPYMFQISVENMIHDAYFTEKIIDCFAAGTIPIYRGTRAVAEYFDADGILFFDTLEELFDILAELSEEDYLSRLPSVKHNSERAKAFYCREDLICTYSDLLLWTRSSN